MCPLCSRDFLCHFFRSSSDHWHPPPPWPPRILWPCHWWSSRKLTDHSWTPWGLSVCCTGPRTWSTRHLAASTIFGVMGGASVSERGFLGPTKAHLWLLAEWSNRDESQTQNGSGVRMGQDGSGFRASEISGSIEVWWSLTPGPQATVYTDAHVYFCPILVF